MGDKLDKPGDQRSPLMQISCGPTRVCRPGVSVMRSPLYGKVCPPAPFPIPVRHSPRFGNFAVNVADGRESLELRKRRRRGKWTHHGQRAASAGPRPSSSSTFPPAPFFLLSSSFLQLAPTSNQQLDHIHHPASQPANRPRLLRSAQASCSCNRIPSPVWS